MKFGKQLSSLAISNVTLIIFIISSQSRLIPPTDYFNYQSLKKSLKSLYLPDGEASSWPWRSQGSSETKDPLAIDSASESFMAILLAEVDRVDALFLARCTFIRDAVAELDAGVSLPTDEWSPEACEKTPSENITKARQLSIHLRALIAFAEATREGLRKILKKHDRLVALFNRPPIGDTFIHAVSGRAVVAPGAGNALLSLLNSVAARMGDDPVASDLGLIDSDSKQPLEEDHFLEEIVDSPRRPRRSYIGELVTGSPSSPNKQQSRHRSPSLPARLSSDRTTFTIPKPSPPPPLTLLGKSDSGDLSAPPPASTSHIKEWVSDLMASRVDKPSRTCVTPPPRGESAPLPEIARRRPRVGSDWFKAYELPVPLVSRPLPHPSSSIQQCPIHGIHLTPSPHLRNSMWNDDEVENVDALRRAMERILRVHHIGSAGVLCTALGGEQLMYGLGDPKSQRRLLGVFVAPLESVLTVEIRRIPSVLNSPKGEFPAYTLWEAGYFSSLVLRGHPDAIDLLFYENFLYTTPEWTALCAMRRRFLSTISGESYMLEAKGQLERLQNGKVRACCTPCVWSTVFRLLLEAQCILRGWNPRVMATAFQEWPFLAAVRRGDERDAEAMRKRALQWFRGAQDLLETARRPCILPNIAEATASATISKAASADERGAHHVMESIRARGGAGVESLSSSVMETGQLIPGVCAAITVTAAAAALCATGILPATYRPRKSGDEAALERWLMSLRLAPLGRGGLHIRG